MRLLAAGLGAALAGPCAAVAADMFWAPPITDALVLPYGDESFGDPIGIGDPVKFADRPHLRVEGEIVSGDAEKLGVMLREKLPDFNVDMHNDVIVSFNSDGGMFAEGLRMADALQGLAVGSYVGAGDQCLSSCALAFLGGSIIYARGTAPQPQRYLNIGGVLGFHAPFTSLDDTLTVPDGTPFSGSLGRRLAGHFYRQAQTAINEITRRMEAMQLAPDFVFAMLTKESRADDQRPIQDQFVLVDNYIALRQTKTTLVAPDFDPPREIGMIDARNVCGLLYGINTKEEFGLFQISLGEGPFDPKAPVGRHSFTRFGLYDTDGPVQTSGGPTPVIAGKKIATSEVRYMLPANGPDSYFVDSLARGLGTMECNVYRGPDGLWYARTFNENIHFPAPDTVRRVVDYEGGVRIGTILRLGLGGSWVDPRLAYGSLDPDLSARFPEVSAPGFDCGGKLDAAAEVTCKYPELGIRDGIMTLLYSTSLATNGSTIRGAQRAWLALRTQACRPERIDRRDAFAERNLAECLILVTEARIAKLLEP